MLLPILDPEREAARLQALRDFDILDSEPEVAFDRITTRVSKLLHVPIVLVTLIERDRQWMKSCYGTTVRESDRESSFCQYSIQGQEVFVVPDALADPRFCDNPFVVGPLGLRFYAGAPLQTSGGFNLGTLCVIDTRPRELSEDEKGLLQDMAAIVVDELELRRAGRALRLEMEERSRAEAGRTRELKQFNLDLGAALRENYAFGAAVRCSVTGVLITDPTRADNPTILINPAFEKITGYTSEDVVGKNCRFLQGADSSPEKIDEMRQAIRDRIPFRGLIRNYRKDGTPFWNELSIDPVFDEDGTLIHFIGLQNDVTERVEAQLALRQSEARLQSILDNTTSVVYIKDLEGRYELVNRRFQEIFGAPAALQEARADDLILPPDGARAIRENDEAVLRSAVPMEFEETVTGVQGARTYISVKFPLRDEQGMVTGLCGLSTDITARKVAEAALRQSEARKAAILEASLDAVITIDHEGRVLEINPATCTIFGYREEEMLGATMAELIVPPALRAAHNAGMRHFLETGHGPALGHRLELPAMRADGTEFPIELTITRIHTEGAPMFTGHIRDITTRKKSEEALHQAKEEAERANTAKSVFLSRMSHELRTPLNAILGFSQLLQRRNLEPRQAESVGYIAKAGRHLLDLVNEVLDLARIEAGHTSWSPEPVPVLEVMEESLDLIRPQALERSIELRLDRSLQQPALCVTADRQRLKQIFVNLLSNGVKYNRECGRLTVRCDETRPGLVTIDFVDTGMGMPEDQLGRLFVPFERLGAEGSGVEGSGIGLALTQRLVTLMGGTIEVSSQLHEGSIFRVLLPRAHAAEVEPVNPPSEAASRMPFTELRTVLYVEDHPANLRLMEQVAAEHGGIELVTTCFGLEAVKLARQHRPELILLDLHLPDISGAQVLRQLRAEPDWCETPILIVSADALSQQVKLLLESGATDYITKPIEVEAMLKLFQDYLGVAA